MADENEVILSPREAARRLGVSPSGLRRLAGVYGDMFGDLPKDASGTSRLWPQEAVGRLEQARALLAAGQARSIRDALTAVESGAAPRGDISVNDGRVAEALGVVATQLQAVLDSNERLEAEVRQLRTIVDVPNPAGLPSDSPTPAGKHGPLVRVALWLEAVLRR